MSLDALAQRIVDLEAEVRGYRGNNLSFAGITIDGHFYTIPDVFERSAEVEAAMDQVTEDMTQLEFDLALARTDLNEVDGKIATAKAEAISEAGFSAQEMADLAQSAAIAEAALEYGPIKDRVNGWTATGKTTIDGGQIETDSITALQIAAGAVTAGKLAADSVLANNIKAGEINAGHIAAKAITAEALAIAPGNVFHDPYITQGHNWSASVFATEADPDMPGGRRLVLTTTSSFNGGWYGGGHHMQVEPGAWYLVTVTMNRRGTTASTNLNPWVQTKHKDTGADLTLYGGAFEAVPANNQYFTVSATVRIPDDSNGLATLGIYTSGTHIAGEEIWIGNIRMQRRAGATLIEDGAITTNKLTALAVNADKIAANAVTAQKILAGSVTAEKLESEMVLATHIIAGNQAGRHARMSPAGFQTYAPDPDGGAPLVATSLGTSSKDSLEIYNAGDLVASVNDEGRGQFSSMSAAGDIDVKSFPLLGTTADYEPAVSGGALIEGHLDKAARGLVAYGTIPTNGQVFNTNVRVFTLRFMAYPGRSYRAVMPSVYVGLGSGANGRATGLRMALATNNGSGGFNSSASLAWSHIEGAGNTTLPSIERTLRCNKGGISAGGELNPGLNEISIWCNGTSTATITLHNNSYNLPITVFDEGLDTPSTGAYVYTAPSAPVRQTYTSVWVASSHRVYEGTGAAVSPQPSDMPHGPVPGVSPVRNRLTHVLFTQGAVSGQTGTTLASAMSGASVQKIEVELYANHWYHGDGGHATIRPSNLTSLPGSGTPGSGTPTRTSKWAKGSSRWVTLTGTLATNAIRSIVVGYPTSTALSEYGRFDAPGSSRPPRLRITYTK